MLLERRFVVLSLFVVTFWAAFPFPSPRPKSVDIQGRYIQCSPARLFPPRPRLPPPGRPQGPPLQRTAGCRCSPVSTLTRRGGCPHPPASFVPVPGSGQPGGHKGRPYKARLLSAAPLVQCLRVGAGLVPAHLFPPRPRLPPDGRPQGPPLQRTAGCCCSLR